VFRDRESDWGFCEFAPFNSLKPGAHADSNYNVVVKATIRPDEDVWSTFQESNRTAVTEATKKLGISMAGLRAKLDDILVDADAQSIQNSTVLATSAVKIKITEKDARGREGDGESNGNSNTTALARSQAQAEIELLEKELIDRSAVARYGPTKLAAVLAAFIISYDCTMGDEFLGNPEN